MSISPEQAGALVRRAAAGDRIAWEELVDAFAGLIWAIARNHRLSDGDSADVSQTTWLRLLENVDRLAEPSRVGAWLATTARRECLRVLGLANRHVLVDDEARLDVPDAAVPDLDAGLLLAEREEAVRVAFEQLPERCQRLLRLLMLDPPPSYEELSAALGVPIGSIGPTRGRCLKKLRDLVEEAGIEGRLARSRD
ncbi:MAG TPA: sigma-70 family RNA polymerase sigma factor [Mycobacteriales bacterium]|nr:sigma-70 family RNA polymerase sigma factor [Mycobacteriales bacterium]